MDNKKTTYLKSQDGFTLLEVLLVVGVLATIALGIVQITNGWANQEKNLSAARHLRIVHSAAESYIRDNFSTIMTALTSGTGVLEIPIDDAGGSVFYLKEGGTYLPSGFRALNSHRQTVTVLVRNASPSPDPEDERIEAVVVTSGRPMVLQDAIDVAQATGSVGGIIAGIDVGTYSANDFGSVYGSWTTSLLNYAGLMWDDNNLPLDTDRAHLAAFIELNYKNVVSDYLYRVEIPGLPDANRMQAHLDMNTNEITGTSQLYADRVNVSGNLTTGNMAVSGGLLLEGNVTVAGGLFVEDEIDFGSTLVQNELIVQENLTTPQIDVTGVLEGRGGARLSATNMDVAGGVSTLEMNAVTLEMNNGSIDMNGGGLASIGEVSNVNLINTGAIGASTIRNAVINATISSIMQPIQVNGNVVFEGDVVTPNAMAIGTLQNCFEVTGELCQ